MNAPALLRLVLRGTALVLALTALVVLVAMNTAMIRYPLYYTGLLLDRPAIVAVREPGSQWQEVTPFVRADRHTFTREPRIEPTPRDVLITGSPGTRVALITNSRISEQELDTEVNDLMAYPRAGLNSIWIVERSANGMSPAGGGDLLESPWTADRIYEGDDGVRATPFGRLPYPVDTSQLVFEGVSQPAPVRFNVAGRDDQLMTLIFGQPRDDRYGHYESGTPDFDRAGIAHAPSVDFSLPTIGMKREVNVTLQNQHEVHVVATLCLPTDAPLMRWAREGQLSAIELLDRLTGVRISPSAQTPLQAIGEGPRDTPVNPSGGDESVSMNCARIDQTVPRAGVSFFAASEFLTRPGDRITVQGFDPRAISPPAEPACEMMAGGFSCVGPVPYTPQLYHYQVLEYPPGAPDRLGDRADTLTRVQHWLGGLSRDLSSALIALLPVLLVYFAVRRSAAWVTPPGQLRSWSEIAMDHRRRALNGLLLLMLVLALAAILQSIVSAIVGTDDLDYLLDPKSSDEFSSFLGLATPLALFAVATAPRFMRRSSPVRSSYALPAIAAVFTVALICAGLFLLIAERVSLMTAEAARDKSDLIGWLTSFENLKRQTGPFVAGGIWLVVCAPFLWAPVYLAHRILAPGGKLLGLSLVTTLAVFLFPLAGDLASAGALWWRFTSVGMEETSSLWGHTLASAVKVVVLIGAVCYALFAFGSLIRGLAPSSLDKKYGHQLRSPLLLLSAAALIALPMLALQGNNERFGQFALIFLSIEVFGAILALAAIVDFAIERHGTDPDRSRRFEWTPAHRYFCAALFAGFVGMWFNSLLAVVLQAPIAFMMFLWAAPAAVKSPDPAPNEQLAQHFLDFKREDTRLHAREEAFERRFTSGEIAPDVFQRAKEEISTLRAAARSQLGMSGEDAKRVLLNFGPREGALLNARTGAIAGLITAAFIQIFYATIVPPGSDLASFAGASQILIRVDDSTTMRIIVEVLNAIAMYVVGGATFGHALHAIRGSDGLAKAVWFAIALMPSYLVGLFATQGHLFTDFMRVTPFILFIAVLGVFVFDGGVLRRTGVPFARWIEIYGLGRVVGYSSVLAGLITAAQPVLSFLGRIPEYLGRQ